MFLPGEIWTVWTGGCAYFFHTCICNRWRFCSFFQNYICIKFFHVLAVCVAGKDVHAEVCVFYHFHFKCLPCSACKRFPFTPRMHVRLWRYNICLILDKHFNKAVHTCSCSVYALADQINDLIWICPPSCRVGTGSCVNPPPTNWYLRECRVNVPNYSPFWNMGFKVK